MWNAVRIAWFEDSKAPLLLGPVHEVVARLREMGVERVMVIPHWKFGPHVDLVVDSPADVFDGEVLSLCHERIGGWLERNPSATVLDPAQYELLSQKVAMTELEPGPYLPLLENNTVARAEYVPSRALKLPQF